MVEPDSLSEYLEKVKEDKDRNKKIVISQFAAKDLVKPKDDNAVFDKSHYY
jgi:hypothetical protein